MKYIKRKLLNYILKNFYSVPIMEDVLKVAGGKFIVNGKELNQQEIRELQSEADFLVRTRLWSVLTESPKNLSQEIMFKKSVSYDDMLGGKFILYTIALQKTIVEKLKSK
jgi:hypothetical protein